MACGAVKQIKLKSNDGEVFVVDLKVAEMSITIKEMLENLGTEDCESDDDIIPVPNVNGPILRKAIEWAEHHKDDTPLADDLDEITKNPIHKNEISIWDAEFLRTDHRILFELILAANYLNIHGLLDLVCKSIAISLRGSTPEEMRSIFNITNDLTPSETEQIRIENAWLDEK